MLDASGENYIVNGTKKWITGKPNVTVSFGERGLPRKPCKSCWNRLGRDGSMSWPLSAASAASLHLLLQPAGGMYADWFVTAVRTGKAGAGGISMMLIPRSDAVQTKQLGEVSGVQGSKGLPEHFDRPRIMKSKYSSSAGTAYVTYENCIVPKNHIIKGENKA